MSGPDNKFPFQRLLARFQDSQACRNTVAYTKDVLRGVCLNPPVGLALVLTPALNVAIPGMAISKIIETARDGNFSDCAAAAGLGTLLFVASLAATYSSVRMAAVFGLDKLPARPKTPELS